MRRFLTSVIATFPAVIRDQFITEAVQLQNSWLHSPTFRPIVANFFKLFFKLNFVFEILIDFLKIINAQYNCFQAPFELNGVAQSWWNDRKGVARYFWAGVDNNQHTCQCGIDNSCIDPSFKCNCDAMTPIGLLNDTGTVKVFSIYQLFNCLIYFKVL